MSEVKKLSEIRKDSVAVGDTLLGLDKAGNPKQIPVGGVAKSGVFYVNAGKKMAFHVPELGYTSFMAGFSNAQRQVYGWLGGYGGEAMRWNLSLSRSSHNIFKAAYATTKSNIFVLEALEDKSLNVVFSSSAVITAEPYDEATHGSLEQLEPEILRGGVIPYGSDNYICITAKPEKGGLHERRCEGIDGLYSGSDVAKCVDIKVQRRNNHPFGFYKNRLVLDHPGSRDNRVSEKCVQIWDNACGQHWVIYPTDVCVSPRFVVNGDSGSLREDDIQVKTHVLDEAFGCSRRNGRLTAGKEVAYV